MARRGGSRRLGCGMARWVEVGSGTAVLVRCGEARRGAVGCGKAVKVRWGRVRSVPVGHGGYGKARCVAARLGLARRLW